MSRQTMMDNIIKKYGYENKHTIYFCKLCEDYLDNEINNCLIEISYRALMDNKVDSL